MFKQVQVHNCSYLSILTTFNLIYTVFTIMILFVMQKEQDFGQNAIIIKMPFNIVTDKTLQNCSLKFKKYNLYKCLQIHING